MYFTRRLSSYVKLNASATEWLQTKWGRRFRIGLLAGTIVSYPVFSILSNGPLVALTFPRKFSTETLPADIEKLVNQEYARFLEKEGRLKKDAPFKTFLNKSSNDHDTMASGSLGVRSGLYTAIPFCAQFRSLEEALEYFREKNHNWVEFLGEKLSVDWDTPTGEEIASTFVLSRNAWKFLALRDFYAHDGYSALAQRSISWATWSTFSCIFTYWLHSSVKLFGGTAPVFGGIYVFLTSAAWFANKHWHYLYRYMTDIHADAESAKSTFEHAEGGREFYWKYLKRNRLLRDLHPYLYTQVTASGDIRGIATPLIVRYEHLKDVNEEDDELKEVVGGDD